MAQFIMGRDGTLGLELGFQVCEEIGEGRGWWGGL